MIHSGPQIAVVTVTHDSAHVLPNWLNALKATTFRESLEICVVDSGSSPSQLEAMRGQCRATVDTFLAMPNVGFGCACNAGAAETSAPLLLFTNPDVELISVPPDALHGAAGLNGAIVGGFATNADEPMRPLGFASDPGLREQAQELTLGRFSRAYADSRHPAWILGAALLISRSDFERLHGFSRELFMYFEDADLCVRHREAGGSIRLDRDLIVTHRGRRSTVPDKRMSVNPALESISHASGRIFAARHGHRWEQPLLYGLLVLFFAPRRLAVMVIRNRVPVVEALGNTLCLLFPRLALRRLGATRCELY